VCLAVIGFYLALEFHEQGIAFAVKGFASWHFHPTFADAIFLNIFAIFAVLIWSRIFVLFFFLYFVKS
jgi:hypothetical protein